MKLTKTQQEVYDNLMLIIRQYGKDYVFGWTLGMLIKLSTNDPQLRIAIKKKAQSKS
jgi:hypothetical protein